MTEARGPRAPAATRSPCSSSRRRWTGAAGWQPPTLSARLERAFAGRLAELPPRTRDAVLVAAAITFAELTWDLSWTAKDGRDRTPVIPAHEVSGTVAGLAGGVTGVAVGDESSA